MTSLARTTGSALSVFTGSANMQTKATTATAPTRGMDQLKAGSQALQSLPQG
jgi:hypothetical protein